ncbi:MAG: hypothetical protein JOZ90_13275 [Alphaproteobacteria bacterium]|nr:hypothetical protein [Alphaproteobacteria bacterium]MBV9372404.1 hypothetical protein [Alphaproteobacteria bacterium]MBV9902043.1 hypothetical protein [Alphaproteobacteria bacterium]
MTDKHEPRLFPDDASIRSVGERMLARTLPKPEWTHEAHLATTLWLIVERPDIVPERDLPNLIRAYNESVGGVNSDSEGYHETITQCFLRAVRLYLARTDPTLPLHEKVNRLLCSEEGRRDWPLCFYDPKTLFSVEARRGWVEPDLAALPEL